MSRPKIDPRTNPKFTTIGDWSWDDNRLWSKVEVDLDTTKCWLWQGSMSPSGALFGGYKGGYRQMTQARRLIWMSENKEDVKPYAIKLTCGCQDCVNPRHFRLEENNRKAWYHD